MAQTECNIGIVVGVISSILVAAGLGATLYVTTTGSGSNGNSTITRSTTPSTTSGAVYMTPCGVCGPEIDVAINIQNSIVEPFFNHTIELFGMRQRELIFFMETAAKKQKEFRFAGAYGQYGFYVQTINGLTSNSDLKTWWQILDQNMEMLKKGVSSHIPIHQETVIFNFTQTVDH
ncbi:cobalamin binding intrinsic factor-like [Haliotis asinina]|uniref:cobalamin binding intrinsic factor-like n=1 Tax=Haliotis asinina TaxID=109174 RepID=UPI0035318D1E